MGRTDDVLRERKQRLLALERAIEAFCEIPAELNMLLLVLADRYMGRAVPRSFSKVPTELVKIFRRNKNKSYRYARISAACRTGYVNNPTFKSDSSTSESSRAFREAASLD